MVMQHIKFEEPVSQDSILAQVKNMRENELLTEDQARTIDVGLIVRFLHSPLGKRCMGARSLKREVPFTLALPAWEVTQLAEKRNSACSGMIDLLAEEEDGLII
jgi:ATP-dependent helicase/nuclease subunit A